MVGDVCNTYKKGFLLIIWSRNEVCYTSSRTAIYEHMGQAQAPAEAASRAVCNAAIHCYLGYTINGVKFNVTDYESPRELNILIYMYSTITHTFHSMYIFR